MLNAVSSCICSTPIAVSVQSSATPAHKRSNNGGQRPKQKRETPSHSQDIFLLFHPDQRFSVLWICFKKLQVCFIKAFSHLPLFSALHDRSTIYNVSWVSICPASFIENHKRWADNGHLQVLATRIMWTNLASFQHILRDSVVFVAYISQPTYNTSNLSTKGWKLLNYHGLNGLPFQFLRFGILAGHPKEGFRIISIQLKIFPAK